MKRRNFYVTHYILFGNMRFCHYCFFLRIGNNFYFKNTIHLEQFYLFTFLDLVHVHIDMIKRYKVKEDKILYNKLKLFFMLISISNILYI